MVGALKARPVTAAKACFVWPHNSGRVQDIVHSDVTIVLDVLDLLPVTEIFFLVKSLGGSRSSEFRGCDLTRF